jgi:hypothetical protein
LDVLELLLDETVVARQLHVGGAEGGRLRSGQGGQPGLLGT